MLDWIVSEAFIGGAFKGAIIGLACGLIVRAIRRKRRANNDT